MTVPQSIHTFLTSLNIPAQPAYLGFSGGIDSTALLVALLDTHIRVTAVHFQHGIRGPEAEADARWCEDFCRRHGVPFRRIDLDVPHHQRPGETTEEAARRLRLEQWTLLAQGQTVFLAHQADDVLEELFLRLARGANASGLTSLRPQRTLHGVTFLRPLLDLTKEDLRTFIEAKGITDWRLDSTNSRNDYRRNAVRNQLLPLARDIFKTDAGFKQAIWALRQDADHLEAEAQDMADRQLALRDWQQLSPALLPRTFRLWRQRQDGIDEPPSRNFIAALRRTLNAPSGHRRPLQLDPLHLVTLDDWGLHLRKLQHIPSFSYVWDWQAKPAITIPEANITLSLQADEHAHGGSAEKFNLQDLPPQLTIRSWNPGDRMIPFGHRSPKKLQDILTDAHLNRYQKQAVPILLAGDTIAWIPFVRRAEFGRSLPQQPSITIHAWRP